MRGLILVVVLSCASILPFIQLQPVGVSFISHVVLTSRTVVMPHALSISLLLGIITPSTSALLMISYVLVHFILLNHVLTFL